MIPATPKNIGWLLTQLYHAKRVLHAQCADPVFVLLTKNIEDRQKVEGIIYKYLCDKYGFDATFTQKIKPEEFKPTVSTFFMPEIGARIVLMDVNL